MNTKIVQPRYYERDTSNMLKQTLIDIAEGITGIASSTKKDLFLSIGHLFQRLLAGQRLDSLKREWDELRKKGRIKKDYQNTEQHKICLLELLDFLDKDLPDEIRFSVLKNIFLVAATENFSDRNSILPFQLMQICRTLSTGEIIVLNTVYKIVKNKTWDKEQDKHKGAAEFLKRIANESGLEYPELVETYELQLIDKRLLMPRRHIDKSGIYISQYFRLTDLGNKICEYIDHYEVITAK